MLDAAAAAGEGGAAYPPPDEIVAYFRRRHPRLGVAAEAGEQLIMTEVTAPPAGASAPQRAKRTCSRSIQLPVTEQIGKLDSCVDDTIYHRLVEVHGMSPQKLQAANCKLACILSLLLCRGLDLLCPQAFFNASLTLPLK